MARLNVELNQAAEFFSRFGRFGGNMQLFKQLLADDERMKSWVASLLDTAPVEHLTAFVSYQLPSYDELDGTAFDSASANFHPWSKWEEHESVRGQVDRTPGERTFLLKHFTKDMRRDGVLAWANVYGYRAATLEEAIDFAKAHPDFQRKFRIAVFGSYTQDGRNCDWFAFLDGDDARRNLRSGWGFDWGAGCRFLLVRK